MGDGLHCLSSMAPRESLLQLAAEFQATTGTPLTVEAMGGVDALRSIRSGRFADIAVLASGALAKLQTEGHVLAGSIVEFARSGMAIAVRRGAGRPDISDGAAVRRSILAAAKVGYSTGPSGDALLKLCEGWGLLPSMADRMVKAPPGVPVAALLTRGDVDLGFQQLSELLHMEGIDVLGPLPPDIQVLTVFSAGVCRTSPSPEAARALLDFLTSPAADRAKRDNGMESAATPPR